MRVSDTLNDFVSEVKINGQDAGNGNTVTIKPDTDYELSLKFTETDNLQFDHDKDSLVYDIPSQINIPNSNGTIPLNLTDRENQAYSINASYRIENNKLYFTFDKNDENYEKLTNTDNVYFNLNLKFKLNNNVTDNEISWGGNKNTTIQVDNEKNLEIEKTGTYNKQKGTFDYTVTVKSTGHNENVVVKDSLTGSAIQYNDDLNVTSNKNKNVDGQYSKQGNGFEYTVSSMSDGEVLTFHYSAKIDYSNLSSNDRFTTDETKNDVSVKSKDVPEQNKEQDFSHETKYNSIKKSGKLSDDGKTVTWTIVVNEDAKVSVVNSTITDSIIKNDKIPMNYNGTGITVQRYNAKNEKVKDPIQINWKDLTSFDKDSGWKYTLPNDSEPYKYVITYTTSVDNSNTLDSSSVENKVEDDKNHSSTSSVNVKPGNNFSVKKTNSGLNADGTVDYTVKVTIPKCGFNESFVVQDFLPKEGSNKYKDTFVDNSLKVMLDDKELTTDNYTLTSNKNNQYTNDDIKLEFKNLATLFKKSDKDRILTITYKIKANTEWLGDHYNTVNVTADGSSSRGDSSKFILSKQTISKSYEKQNDISGLPTYRFFVQLEGVDSDEITVNDEFDKTLLELYQDNISNSVLVGAGDEVWQAKNRSTYYGDGINRGNGGTVKTVATDKGLKFVFQPNKDAEGKYYKYYTIGYTLKVKDKDALKQIQQAAADTKGTYKLSNTAMWGDHKATVDADYTITPVKKSITIWPNDKNNYVATFQIEINPDALTLNDGKQLTVTDEMSSNMRYISGSATANGEKIEPVVGEKTTDLVWKVDDGKKTVITYQARIIGTGNVTYSNKVKITNGYSSELKDNHVSMNTAGAGGGSAISIHLVKRDAQDASKLLGGAKFQLYKKVNDKFQPVVDKNKNNVYFTSSNNSDSLGKVTIFGSLTQDGWNLSNGNTYMLKEVEAPKGYQIGQNIIFTIKETPTQEGDYTNQDTIYVSNTKDEAEKTEISVNKIWKDNNNTNNNRPDSITVKLLKNGEETDKTLILSMNIPWWRSHPIHENRAT